jgi:hypothetical protein
MIVLLHIPVNHLKPCCNFIKRAVTVRCSACSQLPVYPVIIAVNISNSTDSLVWKMERDCSSCGRKLRLICNLDKCQSVEGLRLKLSIKFDDRLLLFLCCKLQQGEIETNRY